MKRALTVLVLIGLLAATLAMPAAAQSQAKSYLILAQGDKLPAKLAQQVRAAGGTVTRTIPEIGIAVATSSNPDFAANASRILGVRSVVPNLRLAWVDPTFGEGVSVEFGNPPTSGGDDFFFDLQWGLDAVDAPEAWNAGARGDGVRVAILDTGFDLDHPDLASNINLGLSANFVAGETLSYARPDAFSHGSHVAGIVAAADNAFGTIGVAPEAELVLVKVVGDAGSGSGTVADIIAGIVYATNVDADIINMSLGVTVNRHGFFDPETGEKLANANEVAEVLVAFGRATTYANQQGTMVIAAAGNDANDFDHNADLIVVPAQSPHVIAIAATGPLGWGLDPSTDLDVPAFYTNFGQSMIAFAAPGGNVDFSLRESGQVCTVVVTAPCWVFDQVLSAGSSLNPGVAIYLWATGTSMAAPYTAGVAAIIIGQHGGDMHPDQVEAALRASADDLGKVGNDDFYGAGRVNAGNTVP
jgi:subtilisin family serine protease